MPIEFEFQKFIEMLAHIENEETGWWDPDLVAYLAVTQDDATTDPSVRAPESNQKEIK
jgi:hypothetical protein